VKLLPCGDAGLLVELPGLDEVLGLHAALEHDPPPGLVALVPAMRTLLVRIDLTETTLADLRSVITAREPRPPDDRDAGTVEIPVVYDGEDREEVGELTGLGSQGVVDAHTDQLWTVAFTGFAPGFGYLVGEDERLHVGRRREPRTEVPTGAVGLADRFSGVYPRGSPGGWQLIGRTELAMWDLERDPPALLTPGTQVRFVEET
jgi:KipI family sensor histidine kinase inhibitor